MIGVSVDAGFILYMRWGLRINRHSIHVPGVEVMVVNGWMEGFVSLENENLMC